MSEQRSWKSIEIIGWAVGGALVVGLILMVAHATGFLDWLFSNCLSPEEKLSVICRDRTAVAVSWLGVLGGAIGLLLAWRRTSTATRQADTANKQTMLAERGQNLDRYQKGSQMLGDENLQVRLGGIYALRDVALADPETFHETVLNLFCAFLRHPVEDKALEDRLWHVHPKEWNLEVPLSRKTPVADRRRRIRPDFEAALGAISSVRCGSPNAKAPYRLNLDHVDFSYCLLPLNLDLSNISLANADFSFARGWQTVFSRTDLFNADFRNARFRHADLTSAKLILSNFAGSDFRWANLSDATLDSIEGYEDFFSSPKWAWKDHAPQDLEAGTKMWLVGPEYRSEYEDATRERFVFLKAKSVLHRLEDERWVVASDT